MGCNKLWINKIPAIIDKGNAKLGALWHERSINFNIVK